MELQYRKLISLKILHDFYLDGVETSGSVWPGNYNIHTDFDICPTQETREFFRSLNVVFKQNNYGFDLFIRTDQPAINTPDDYPSFIYISPDVKFSFIIRLKNNFFINYTNLRLPGNRENIYYFNNQIKNELTYTFDEDGTPETKVIQFLSKPMIGFTPNAAGLSHHLGDLILRPDDTIFEAKENIINDNNFDNTKWATIDIPDAYYVTVGDRLPRQALSFIYFDEDNSNPNEIINFVLKDLFDRPVDLGLISNITQPQATFATPAQAADAVNYSLDLSRIPMGAYTLETTRGGVAEPDRNFFLLNKQIYPGAFAILDLFAGTPPGVTNLDTELQFVEDRATANRMQSIINPKTFELRFRNRTTQWKYIKPDGEIADGPLRELTKKHQEFKLDNISLPNPDVALIQAESNIENTDLIEKIESNIYLSEQYKIT